MAENFTCPPPEAGLVPGGPGRTFTLACTVLFPLLVVGSILVFKFYQQTSVYLRKRSVSVILLTTCLSAFLWGCTALYDVIGPEKYPCALFGVLQIVFLPCVNLPPLIALARYRNEVAAYTRIQKRNYRGSTLSSNPNPSNDESDWKKITWGQAFYGHVRTTFGSRNKTHRIWHAKFARSIYFMLFYSSVNITPYVIYFLVKLGTEPSYYHGCSGCELETPDAIFLLVMLNINVGMGVGLNSSRVKKRDPLRIVRECVFIWLFSGIFLTAAFALFLADPEGTYRPQGLFNWRLLVLFACYSIIYLQTIHQVIVAKLLKRALLLSGNIGQAERFTDVMTDKNLKNELKAYLNAELSGEILPFLEAVEAFRSNFERGDSSSRAVVMVDTFVKINADLEVNISGVTRMKLLEAAAQGTWEIDTFDRAYEEIRSSLINDGFARFLDTLKKSSSSSAHKSTSRNHLSTVVVGTVDELQQKGTGEA